jgi:hypothetical protein
MTTGLSSDISLPRMLMEYDIKNIKAAPFPRLIAKVAIKNKKQKNKQVVNSIEYSIVFHIFAFK